MRLPTYINKKTYKILFASVIVAVFALVMYAGFCYIVVGKASSMAEISEDAAGVLSAKETAQSLKRLIFETEKERAQIDSYFIDEEGAVSFIEEMEAIGDASGLELELVSVNIDPKEDTLKLQVKTQGLWVNTAYFLRLIENIPRKINLSRVSMRRSGNSSNKEPKAVWTGEFTVRLDSFIKNAE